MTMGDRVRTAREKKGYTQEELAQKLGYKSRSSVNKIEKERDIPRSMIVKLAKILDVTPAHLMGWDKSSIIRDRASDLCQEKGITIETMASDLNIDLSILTEFDKTELEAKIEPISDQAMTALFEMSKYLETTMAYLLGAMDNREQSRLLSGKEIFGKPDFIDVTPKDARFRDIVVKIDALPDSDRSSLLDQIENLLQFYYQTLLNNQKSERSDA